MSPEPSRIPALLADLLCAEAAVFDELADLAAQQRRLLLDADEDGLLALAARAETLATRFRLLEDERGRTERLGLPDGAPELDEAREVLKAALGRLLRETAIAGTILERLGDTVAARQAAVGAMFGTTYYADGRARVRRIAGGALCAEG